MTETEKVPVTPEIEKHLIDNQLLKRAVKPEDIASAAAFMASDEASMIAGQTVAVNGG